VKQGKYGVSGEFRVEQPANRIADVKKLPL
jgi:hypothetical protein